MENQLDELCAAGLHAKLLHLCPTLCDPMGSSPPGSSDHGILQAGILEWVAIFSSRGSPTQGSNPHLLHWQVDSLPLSHLGSPKYISIYYKIVEKSHRVLSGVNCPPLWLLNTGPYSFTYTYLSHEDVAVVIQAGVGSGWEACLDTRFKNSFFTSPFPVFC